MLDAPFSEKNIRVFAIDPGNIRYLYAAVRYRGPDTSMLKSLSPICNSAFPFNSFPSFLSRALKQGCLATLWGLFAVVACGAWSAAVAQTAHFARAQSVVANAANDGLFHASGVAVDGSGNVYVADSGNDRVLKETLSAGGYIQSVVANAANNGLGSPAGVAVDGSGNVYIADYEYSQVLKETTSAGGYTQSVVANSTDNGLSGPAGIAVDGGGNVYIADLSNSRVLKETLSADSYTQSVVANAASNGLSAPWGVAVDRSGNVYIADFMNYRVLKETLSAGDYTQSVVANAATNGLFLPYGVAVDRSGNVYIADSANNRVLKETFSEGTYAQTVVADSATNGLDYPYAVAVDVGGTVYIADYNNNLVLKETSSGGNFGTVNVGSASPSPISMIFTFNTAGTLGSTAVVTQGATGLDFSNAGTGTCTAGTAYTVGESCTVDVSFKPKFAGTRYGAAELLNGSGKVIATGYVEGTGVGPQVNFPPGTQSVVASATNNGLNHPFGVAVDGNGNIYIADDWNNRVLKETLSAGSYVQSVVANNANNGLYDPWDVAVDGSGNVYIADYYNQRVLKEMPSAGGYTQSVVANYASNGLNSPEGVAVDGSGNVYIADYWNSRVLKETLSAGGYTQSVVADGPVNGLDETAGVAVDGSGNVYIADYYSNRVLKETLSADGYTQTVIANSANNGLKYPYGVAVDGSGNIYIADSDNSRVLKETPSAGSYTQSVIANAANNGLDNPYAVAVDGSGNVYIADSFNSRVLKEDFADPPSLTFAATAVGKTSTDSPQTVTVENVGNAPLSFPIPTTGTNPSIATNFTLNSSGAAACKVENSGTATEETLSPNASCEFAISFEPEIGGTLSGSLVLTDTNLNASAPGYASQSILLTGTVIRLTPTITWATPAAINYGTALSGTQLDASSSVAGTFAYSPAAGTILQAGSNELSVTFTPTNTADYTTATSDVTLVVNPIPIVSLSATSLVFGNEAVGSASAPQSVTLTNTGDAPLSISSIAVTGADASSFVFANTCGSSLAEGANCSIHGHFAPIAAGALTASITITENASGSPRNISLSGIGLRPAVSLSASSLSFGSQTVGTASASQWVTLTSSGDAPVLITSIGVTGADASSFDFANNCGNSLAVGASCSIHGHFAPAAAGALTAAITITDNAAGSPHSVAMSGTGLGPAVSLSAASLTFGMQGIGTASLSQAVALTNTGNEPLTIASIGVTGADASSFDFANSCGATLAVGAACSIHGHFAPTAVGALTAAIVITDNAAGSPHSVALNGTGLGPTVSLSAASLTFGSQAVGTASVSQAVTLANTGNEALSITSIKVTGADASSFDFANDCGTSLAAGANCSIHGHFGPTTGGALSAAITIVDNAGNSPQSIALSGTGLGPALSLSTASLAFGSEAVGMATASQSVTLINSGNEPLSITSIKVTGADASSYDFANSCATSLAAGSSCTIHGHFAPAAAGALTAFITITDNAGGSPRSIALSGTGQ